MIADCQFPIADLWRLLSGEIGAAIGSWELAIGNRKLAKPK